MQQNQVGKFECRPPAVIHLDLDGAKHIFRVHGWRYEADRDPIFENGLLRAIDFFDRFGVQATLFVIAEDLTDSRKGELIKEAVRKGHEIASHSLSHSKLTTLDRASKRREIFESRKRIAAELGVEVHGFRSPLFDIDRETLELVGEAGYTYDSSLFPSIRSSRQVGLTRFSQEPYHPLDYLPLKELPMPSYRPLPLPFHPCYSLVIGMWYFQLGLRRFQRTAAPLVILFHLTDFADPLPAKQLPNWRAKLFTLSHLSGEYKLRRCKQMLELVQQKYKTMDTMQLLTRAQSTQAEDFGMALQS